MLDTHVRLAVLLEIQHVPGKLQLRAAMKATPVLPILLLMSSSLAVCPGEESREPFGDGAIFQQVGSNDYLLVSFF